ncbi:MAG TPA: hypothetical protein VN088_08445 [Nocardioides sp.]|nr:hypothetical protein [Nocardioides sp.]
MPEFKPAGFNASTPIACGQCTRGWLRELDEQASLLLTDLFNNTRREFNARDVATLKRWAVKAAITMERTEPARAAFNAAMTTAVRRAKPVPGAIVFAGVRPPVGALLEWTRLGLELAVDRGAKPPLTLRGYNYSKVVIGCGPAVFAVFLSHGEAAESAILAARDSYSDVMLELTAAGMSWPPPAMTLEDYEDIKGGAELVPGDEKSQTSAAADDPSDHGASTCSVPFTQRDRDGVDLPRSSGSAT